MDDRFIGSTIHSDERSPFDKKSFTVLVAARPRISRKTYTTVHMGDLENRYRRSLSYAQTGQTTTAYF